MRTRRTGGLLTALCLLVVAAQPLRGASAPPPALARSGPWVVNYDDDSCTLASSFGEEKQPLILRLTWFAPGDTFQVMLIGKSVPATGTSTPFTIDFGPEVNPRNNKASVGTVGPLPMLLLTEARIDDGASDSKDENSGRPVPITAQQEAAVAYVDMRAGPKRWRLALPAFGKALASVHDCQRDLLKTWKFDPDVQLGLSRAARPIGSPSSWINSSDYPVGALYAGLNGLVRFRLTVSEEGKITGCHVQMAMKPADFETVTCKLIERRARMSPAFDKDGRPVASYYINSVQWVNVN